MGSPLARPDDPPLVGRSAECARIEQLLDEVREGSSRVLVLRGDAGIGKTRLALWAIARADGFTVARSRPVESEAELAFAGLHDLLRPLLPLRDALTPRQGMALEGALALGAPVGEGDRFAVCAATLGLLARAAEQAPLLVVMEDVQWLDAASAEALAFATRRLEADRVAVLMTARDALPPSIAGAGFDALDVTGLDRVAAAELLRWAAPDVAPAVVERLWEATAGNPLAMVEIARALGPEERAGRAPLALDAADGLAPVERALLDRVRRLPAATRTLLLVGAASDDGELGPIVAAAAALGADGGSLEPAEEAGVIELRGNRLRFVHPLLRRSVYAAAAPGDRRAAHRALGDALPDASADARAWHRASAAVGPDETIAAALEDTAQMARTRLGYAAAQRALERAADLSGDPAARARRLRDAASAAVHAGRPQQALTLLDLADRRGPAGGDGVDVVGLRGRVATRAGRASEAHALLVGEAARLAETDPARAARLYADAVLPALRAGRPGAALDAGSRASRLLAEAGGGPDVSVSLMHGIALLFAGDHAEGAALVAAAADRVEDGTSTVDDPLVEAYLATGLRFAGDGERAAQLLGRLVARARAESAPGVLAYALARLGGLELEQGRWSLARATLEESARLARETGQSADLGIALGAAGWLAAAQGDEPRCRAAAGEALELARDLGHGARRDYAAPALALLDLGCGRAEAAAHELERLVGLDELEGWCDAAVPPHHVPDLVEALFRSGRTADAEARAIAYAEEAERVGRASALAAAERCLGLVATAAELDERFEAARRHNAEAGNPFESARTDLLHGERLRREGRRVDGRGACARPSTRSPRSARSRGWSARSRSCGRRGRCCGGAIRPRSTS